MKETFDHRRAAELTGALAKASRDVRRAIITADLELLAEAAEDAHDAAGRLLDLVSSPGQAPSS